MDLLPSSCICLMIVVHNKMIMTERRLLPTSNLGRCLCAPLGGSRSFPLLLSWVAWGDVWRRSPLLCWGLRHWSWLHWCIPMTDERWWHEGGALHEQASSTGDQWRSGPCCLLGSRHPQIAEESRCRRKQ